MTPPHDGNPQEPDYVTPTPDVDMSAASRAEEAFAIWWREAQPFLSKALIRARQQIPVEPDKGYARRLWERGVHGAQEHEGNMMTMSLGELYDELECEPIDNVMYQMELLRREKAGQA